MCLCIPHFCVLVSAFDSPSTSILLHVSLHSASARDLAPSFLYSCFDFHVLTITGSMHSRQQESLHYFSSDCVLVCVYTEIIRCLDALQLSANRLSTCLLARVCLLFAGIAVRRVPCSLGIQERRGCSCFLASLRFLLLLRVIISERARAVRPIGIANFRFSSLMRSRHACQLEARTRCVHSAPSHR